jgi:Holliday junction resolvasome RuvABC DNA-binding subunit
MKVFSKRCHKQHNSLDSNNFIEPLQDSNVGGIGYEGENMNDLLTDVAGIGDSTALLLNEHGIDSVKSLRKGGVKKLLQVPGFGEIRASAIISAADALAQSAKGNNQEGKTEKKVKDVAGNTKKAGAFSFMKKVFEAYKKIKNETDDR